MALSLLPCVLSSEGDCRREVGEKAAWLRVPQTVQFPQYFDPTASVSKEESPRPLFGFYVWLCQLRLVASSSICNGSLTLWLGLYMVCERQRSGCWMDKMEQKC